MPRRTRENPWGVAMLDLPDLVKDGLSMSRVIVVLR